MDFATSLLLLKFPVLQIAAGDNVVLFANHQSEADPQIYSVLLDPKVGIHSRQTLRPRDLWLAV